MQKLINYLRDIALPQRILLIGWVILMVLMPFHAFISTWGGTTIGPYGLWKVWKEILLLLLFVPTGYIFFKNTKLRKEVLKSWLMKVAAAYVLVHVFATIFNASDIDATAYGLAINLRIIGFFFVSYVLFSSINFSSKRVMQILLVPCSLVVLFGLLQMFVLPNDFLSWFGYEKGETIAPSMNIDEQPDEVRVMSTLRGPNPLGAYLILPGLILIMLIIQRILKKRVLKINIKVILYIVLLLGLLMVLYGTHGRASWIAFAVSVGITSLILLPKKLRILAALAGAILIVLAGGLIYINRETPFVQTVILHDNPETGGEVTSNDAHVTAATDAAKDIADNPLLGCAPGCAGPASYYHQDGARISENYYLQIGQEVGIIGMILFIGFVTLVGVSLWQRREDSIALVLLASLIGLSLANLLLHVWADDTIAYVWWGVAGFSLAQTTRGKVLKK